MKGRYQEGNRAKERTQNFSNALDTEHLLRVLPTYSNTCIIFKQFALGDFGLY